jgi:glycine dehydrogenase subunit 1
MHMTAMGPAGLREVAEQCWHKAHYLAKQIADLDGYALKHDGDFFNEFVVSCPRPASAIIEAAKNKGVFPGVDLSSPKAGRIGAGTDLLVAVTEKRTREELDELVNILREAAA